MVLQRPFKLHPDIVGGIPQRPIALSLGVEPAEEGVTASLSSMVNAKAVDPDELSLKFLKFGLRHDPTFLRTFQRIIEIVGGEGESNVTVARCGGQSSA